jgi:hypothetical protein
MAINIPNDHKIYQHFPFQGPPKYTQIGTFSMRNAIWQSLLFSLCLGLDKIAIFPPKKRRLSHLGGWVITTQGRPLKSWMRLRDLTKAGVKHDRFAHA